MFLGLILFLLGWIPIVVVIYFFGVRQTNWPGKKK